MNDPSFCAQCKATLKPKAPFCPICGAPITFTLPPQSISENTPVKPIIRIRSPKSGKIALLLNILFGVLGGHRFYVGKRWSGLLMLVTGGCIGIGVLLDLIWIVNNKFTDKQGLPLITSNLSPLKRIILGGASIIAWLATLILAVILFIFYLTNGLVTTVTNQLIALRSHDVNKAYSYTSKVFQNAVSLDQFKGFVEQFPPLKNNVSASFENRSINSTRGSLTGILTAKEGQKTYIVYRFVKEDGLWKIINIAPQVEMKTESTSH
jgi:TM2 domain-containing membrane protein YozV